ncbi:MAG: T9SS type A sorting domain-containing protein, partial [Calditrichaceae bacterium]
DNQIIPETFYVGQNYPNPFNPETTIEFGTAGRGHVEITVFDITGKLVATLLDNEVTAGTHQVKWNASGFASGLYFYKVKTSDRMITKKLILMK